ncbi:MAG: hypothetical protein BJ554DRAFT_4788, partial [Olpidium bornovanus]
RNRKRTNTQPHNCGKQGHISAECHRRRKKEKDGRQTQEHDKGSANVGKGHDYEDDSSESDRDGTALMAYMSLCPSQEW